MRRMNAKRGRGQAMRSTVIAIVCGLLFGYGLAAMVSIGAGGAASTEPAVIADVNTEVTQDIAAPTTAEMPPTEAVDAQPTETAESASAFTFPSLSLPAFPGAEDETAESEEAFEGENAPDLDAEPTEAPEPTEVFESEELLEDELAEPEEPTETPEPTEVFESEAPIEDELIEPEEPTETPESEEPTEEFEPEEPIETEEPTETPEPTEEFEPEEPIETEEPTETPEPTELPEPTEAPSPTPTPTSAAPTNASGGARVALVDFSGGYEIIRDTAMQTTDPLQAHLRIDQGNQFTDPCAQGADRVEWKDCAGGLPDGAPEKNWPVAYVRSGRVGIDKAVFTLLEAPQVTLQNVTVVGTARLGNGDTIVFEQRGVSANGATIEIVNVNGRGELPDYVTSFKPLMIEWKIMDAGGGLLFEAGGSQHTVYVLLNEPLTNVYLTPADLTTERARKKRGESDVVEAIWKAFRKPVQDGRIAKTIQRRDLDPITGVITLGAALQYAEPWSLSQALAAPDHGLDPCARHATTAAGLLNRTIGVCDAWAELLAEALRIHGIQANVRQAGDIEGFPRGPDGAMLMLMKKWKFSGKDTSTGDTQFPYRLEYSLQPTAQGPQATIVRQGFVDEVGVGGQNNIDPPGWLPLGRHALVEYGEERELYDPSYGIGPFEDIEDWAEASLAGYARVVQSGLELRAHKGIP